MNVRVFEAFAGYGSQAMALRRLAEDYPRFSFEVVGISEIDRYALQAYRVVHGDVTNYGDITRIDWDKVPDFDLFTYSFPCQDVSFAGKQQGFTEGSGTRSSLLWECRKAILAKRPQWLLMENVKALVSEKFLPLFREWEQWLASIGYSNYTQVLNAKDYGVPQNRERVFMVSTLSDAPYFFPKPLDVKCRLGDILEESVDGRYFLSEKFIECFLNFNKRHNENKFKPVEIENVAHTLTTTGQNQARGNYVFDKAYVSYTRDAKGKVIGRHFKDIANTVHTSTGQGGNTDGYIACALHGRGDGNRQRLEMGGTVSNAITTVAKDALVAENPIGIRKLTERECFRLMDVSESDIDKIQAAGISRTQQYKMAGNSIVVSVLYHIFRKMFVEIQCETRQLKLF